MPGLNIFHKHQEGCHLLPGLNITYKTPNTFLSLIFKIPLLFKIKRDTWFDFHSGVYCFDSVLMPYFCFRFRIRRWEFVLRRYDTFLKRLMDLFVFQSRVFLELVKYKKSKTLEEVEDGRW